MSYISVRPGEDGRLIIVLPYSAERLAKIRTVPARRWHGPEKYWSIPQDEGAASRLQALFAGDRVELDPSLAPAPRPGAANALLDKVRAAIRARHYSPCTEETYVG